MRPSIASRAPRTVLAVCAALLLSGLAVTDTAAHASSTAETITVAPTGTLKVQWRGMGHGHGMSQYGARGAAIKGLSAAQIVAFYYPGTKLVTLASEPTIRVLLSGVGADTTVYGRTAGLKVSGHALPSGYTYFRLVPSGSVLKVQGEKAGKWAPVKPAITLTSRADFSSSAGWVQVRMSGGTTTRYHGTVGAVRSGAGELTVNRVKLDQYVQGSVPREVPASWQAAAVRAQAIAARSYAQFEMSQAGAHSLYDICDNTNCQMYGGMTHYDSHGNVLWTDDPAALTGNADKVLQYKGAPVFAQYSASNGGATVDGGQPYLVGKTDPYDTTASGDPYLNETVTAHASSVARYFGLTKVTSIKITSRDGHGPWGGRVETAVIGGTKSGKATHVSATGFDLGYAVGANTDYLRFVSTVHAPSAPTGVHATAGDAGATISWAAPTSNGGAAITGYRLSWSGHSRTVSASQTSSWVAPLSNLGANTVTVQAVNAAGRGASATVRVSPRAAPQHVVPLAAKRVASGSATSSHPLRFTVRGAGGVPRSGARSVQLNVTVHSPTASGLLTVAPTGQAPVTLGTVAYTKRHNATTTVSVPLQSAGRIVLAPSAGSMRLTIDQESYTAPSGSRVQIVGRRTLTDLSAVPTGSGRAFAVRGISAKATGVLVAIDSSATRATTLRVWADGSAAPHGQQVTVSAYSSATNTVVVPLTSRHRLRIAAGRSGVSARVVLLGVLGPSGNLLETVPPASLTAGRTVGTSPVHVRARGVAQVPTNATAVLVALRARSAGHSGALWAYPSAPHHARKPRALRFGSSGTTSSIMLVKFSGASTIALRSSASGVHVSAAVIGYVV